MEEAEKVCMGASGMSPPSATEFRIMELLIRDAGNVLSRSHLSSVVRDVDPDPNDRAIDAHVKSIRRKLGSGAAAIQTVRGFGFRLDT